VLLTLTARAIDWRMRWIRRPNFRRFPILLPPPSTNLENRHDTNAYFCKSAFPHWDVAYRSITDRNGTRRRFGDAVGRSVTSHLGIHPRPGIVAVIVIIATGLALAFGDTSGGFRKLIQIVFGLSIAFAASSFFLSFFSFSGGALV